MDFHLEGVENEQQGVINEQGGVDFHLEGVENEQGGVENEQQGVENE